MKLTLNELKAVATHRAGNLYTKHLLITLGVLCGWCLLMISLLFAGSRSGVVDDVTTYVAGNSIINITKSYVTLDGVIATKMGIVDTILPEQALGGFWFLYGVPIACMGYMFFILYKVNKATLKFLDDYKVEA
jgi:hypothetical protein